MRTHLCPISSKEEALKALQEGIAYIDTAFDNSLQTAELYRINLTKPYYSIPMEKIENPKVKENISTFLTDILFPQH